MGNSFNPLKRDFLKQIYSEILDNENIADEKKLEWIVASMTKNGQLRNKRVEMLFDLLNEKEYFFEEFYHLIFERFDELNENNQEKVLAYANSHSEELPDNTEIQERVFEMKYPTFRLYSKLSEDAQNELLEKIETDLSDEDMEDTDFIKLKSIRNELYYYIHRGEENPWKIISNDVIKYNIFSHLTTKEKLNLKFVAKDFEHGYYSEGIINQMNAGKSLSAIGFRSIGHIIEFVEKYGTDIKTFNLVRLPVSFEELEELLSYLPNLHSLGVRCCKIDEQSVQLIADSESLENLSSLDLSGNLLSLKSVQSIANSENLMNLSSLELIGCVINDEGVHAIANSENLMSLSTLNLRNNLITDEGVESIINSENLKSLSSLDLSYNLINDEGVEAINNPENLKNLTSLRLEKPNKRLISIAEALTLI
jgi:hypothetical protein